MLNLISDRYLPLGAAGSSLCIICKFVVLALGQHAHPPAALNQDFATRAVGDTMAMLLPVAPEALEAPPVPPCEDPEAGLLILYVLASEGSAVWPRVLATAIDHGAFPHAPKLPAILPYIVAIAVDGIGLPMSRVQGAIGPFIYSITLFLPLDELAVVLGTAIPLLHAIAVLEICYPLATIDCEAPLVVVNAIALRRVLPPLAHEYIAIGVGELPMAMGTVITPVSDEDRAVRPGLHALSMPGVSLPLAKVRRTRLEGVDRPRTSSDKSPESPELRYFPSEVALAGDVVRVAHRSISLPVAVAISVSAVSLWVST